MQPTTGRGIVAMVSAMALFIGNEHPDEARPRGLSRRAGNRAAHRLRRHGRARMVLLLKEGGKARLGCCGDRAAARLIESAVALSFIWALGLLPLGNITAI